MEIRVKTVDKVIGSAAEYGIALAELESLIDRGTQDSTPESDRLKLLTLLVRDYESRNVKFELPSPLDAIKFRMEQANLTARDLIPFLGSRSKVSEVLGGKRTLSLSMVRALSKGLGIPAEVLVQKQPQKAQPKVTELWREYPISEMVKRGWISSSGVERPQDALEVFLRPLSQVPQLAAFRRTITVRSSGRFDAKALEAWTARVIGKAFERDREALGSEPLTLEQLRQLVQLSLAPDWPTLVRAKLRTFGVVLIIERHLPHTYLDGAALLTADGRRIVALTLRHDRLDYFWFTLIHELVHVALHLSERAPSFFDNLEAKAPDVKIEAEADLIASELLVPTDVWRRSPASKLRSVEAATHLAGQLRIHPAIAAGRVRREFGNYGVLASLVGTGEVRRRFEEYE